MKRIAAPMVGGLVTSFLLELLVYPAIFASVEGAAFARNRGGASMKRGIVAIVLGLLAASPVAWLGCQSAPAGREIQVAVTEKGFEPNEIHVKKGETSSSRSRGRPT